MSVISIDSPEGRRFAAKRHLDEAVRRLAGASARGEPLQDVLSELDAARAALESVDTPKPDSLAELWQPIGQWAALTTAPEPRRWLLRRPDPTTNGETSVGVLPLGKCGLFYGDGGAGKSWALLELAMAVAIGRRWLDCFDVPHVGRVLLAMGEEDHDELHRRLYAIGRAMRLTPEQEQLAHDRIVALPLAGRPTALIDSDRGQTVETTLVHDLRARLTAGDDWRLVIIDPLSRFAGGDTEKDNAAATRFVQTVESLVDVPGHPTVLVSHHTRKPPGDAAARKGANGANAANARGASALVAGFRWAAELERLGDDVARLTVTKSNYAPQGSPVDLVRDLAADGYLRVATPAERQEAASAAEQEAMEEQSERSKALQAKILGALSRTPGLTKGALRAEIGGRDIDVRAAVDVLIARGLVVHSAGAKHGLELAREVAQ